MKVESSDLYVEYVHFVANKAVRFVSNRVLGFSDNLLLSTDCFVCLRRKGLPLLEQDRASPR